jgi:hypothetical protein
MASRTTELSLRVVADVTDATAGLDAAAGKLDSVAGSAENLDGKMGAATGALGALSAGFELVGLEQYAEGLQSAAMATDFFSGVGQTATLVLESTKVQAGLAKAQTVAHGIATKGTAAATATMTVAQRALNVAMRANPIGLIVTALTLLVGGLVLAYNKSDTFRSLVNRVGEAGRAAFKLITDKVGDAVDAVGDVIDWVGRIPEKFDTVKGKAEQVGEALGAPFEWAAGKVEDLIGWIGRIDFPSPPKWLTDIIPGGGGNGRYTLDSFVPSSTPAAPAAPAVSIVVQGAVDPYSTAVQIRDLLARYGLATTVTPPAVIV